MNPERRPCIGRHVKSSVQPQFKALVCRCNGRWPPDDALVSYLVIRLLAGLEDDREWSDDVLRAVEVERAARDAVTRAVRRHPDVKEQVAAGREVVMTRLFQLMKRRRQGHPRLGDQELATYERETRAMQATAMRAAAERQRQRRMWECKDEPVKRGRPQQSHLELRSLIDGWNWQGGRPREFAVTELLLRVEVWRDVRAQVRPADGRLLRAEALAEVLVSDLKTSDLATERATYKLVDGLRRCYEEEEEYAPTRALTRAVTDVKGEHLNGKHFRNLQSLFSQALRRLRSATAPTY